ncbi:MAG: hypothetical protein R3208_16770 [Ketobacteraceae bacterium]|nr:hypothetical protein [Ketobacteraceae bacterium]
MSKRPVDRTETKKDDYFLDESPKQPLARWLFNRECEQKSRRFGMPRREFVTGSMGAMAAMSVLGQLAGFSSKAEAMTGFVGPSEDDYQSLAAFTRLDQSTSLDWAAIDAAVRQQQPGVVTTILNMLDGCRDVHLGFGPDQYTHMTQCATRARRGGASDELILVGLIHDLGKVISNLSHPDIIAGIARPYVSEGAYYMLRHHMEFQWKHYGKHVFRPTNGRDRYIGEPWYEDAVRFSDEFDQTAFDPDYPSDPIEDFIPLIEQFFGNAEPKKHSSHKVCVG